MRKFTVLIITLLFLMSMPLVALAMSQDKDDHKGMDHSMHDSMDKSGHDHGMHGSDMHGGMEMLGQCEREGVSAMAHIKSYDADAMASMKKMGMNGTHHLMIFFEDHGESIADGMAAVKLTGPDGKTSEPVKLMLMGKGFGADVAFQEKGEYAIEVGTKLKDGKKRVFEFSYYNK